MRRTLIASLAVLVAVACGDSEPVSDTPTPIQEPIVAAVVRSDSFLVPFAVFENGDWHGPDAGSGNTIAELDAAWFVGRLDSLREWRLVTPLGLADVGGDPILLRVTGAPTDIGTHCQRAWAMRVDPADTGLAQDAGPQILGAALSNASGLELTPAAVLDPTPEEHSKLMSFVEPHFERAEAREADRRSASPDYKPRATGAANAVTPLALDALHRVAGVDGTSIYQFEVSRGYPRAARSPMRNCPALSVMTGWMAEAPDGTFRLIAGDVVMTDCLRKGATRVIPIGAVRLGSRTFAVTLERHYESDAYAVLEIAPTTITPAVRIQGGGC